MGGKLKSKREFIIDFCIKFCNRYCLYKDEFIEEDRCLDCLEKIEVLYEKYVKQING